MGYYIKVNHNDLVDAANAIDTYIEKLNSNMKITDDWVDSLTSASWKHADANKFKIKWEEARGSSAVTGQLKKSLKNYAASLRFASDQYKDAQSASIEESRWLW